MKPKRGPIIRTDYVIQILFRGYTKWVDRQRVYDTRDEAEIDRSGILRDSKTRIVERKWRVL